MRENPKIIKNLGKAHLKFRKEFVGSFFSRDPWFGRIAQKYLSKVVIAQQETENAAARGSVIEGKDILLYQALDSARKNIMKKYNVKSPAEADRLLKLKISQFREQLNDIRQKLGAQRVAFANERKYAGSYHWSMGIIWTLDTFLLGLLESIPRVGK